MLAVSDLYLQACISFSSISDKSGAATGAFLLLPSSHKNAVAHMDMVFLPTRVRFFQGNQCFSSGESMEAIREASKPRWT